MMLIFIVSSLVLSIFSLKFFLLLVTTALSGYLIKSLSDTLFESKYYQKILFHIQALFKRKQPEAANINKIKWVIAQFIDKFATNFIETWYFSFVSTNEDFTRDAKIQLNHLFVDLFLKLSRANKLKLLREILFELNTNFINFNHNPSKISIENLHPALGNSEIDYIRHCVRLILDKSSSKGSYLNDSLLGDLLNEIIGKNCLIKLVDLMSEPNFLFYCLIILCDRNFDAELFSKENQIQNEEVIVIKDQTSFSSADDNSSNFTEIQESFKYFNSDTPELNSQQSLSLSNIQIKSLSISETLKNYDSKNGEPYTLYEIHCVYNKDNLMEPKTKKIKRRFSEFVLLHKKLEANLLLKPLLKCIRGPSSTFSLPIGNMDEQYIRKRKEKLTKYLESIIEIQEVCQSDELNEFLGLKILKNTEDCGEDTQLSENTNQNLLKLFNDILDKINPLKKIDSNSSKHTTLSNASSLSNLQGCLFDNGEKLNFLNYEYSRYSCDNLTLKFDTFLESHFKTDDDDDDVHLTNENQILYEQECHKSSYQVPTFTQLLYDVIIKLMSNRKQHFLASKSIKTILCDCIGAFYAERLFEIMFNKLLSDDKLLEYIQMLQNKLFDTSKSIKLDLLKKIDLSFKAKETISHRIPNLIKIIIGLDTVDKALDEFITSLKSPLLNRHFSYCFIDILINNLFINTQL